MRFTGLRRHGVYQLSLDGWRADGPTIAAKDALESWRHEQCPVPVRSDLACAFSCHFSAINLRGINHDRIMQPTPRAQAQHVTRGLDPEQTELESESESESASQSQSTPA